MEGTMQEMLDWLIQKSPRWGTWCQHCEKDIRGFLVRQGMASNGYHIKVLCPHCLRSARGKANKPWLARPKSIQMDQIPVWDEAPSRWKKRCQRCKTLGAEEHHIAQRKIFPDFNEWPTVWLCKACHQEFHEIERVYYEAVE
jgi:hypothetical protein